MIAQTDTLPSPANGPTPHRGSVVLFSSLRMDVQVGRVAARDGRPAGLSGDGAAPHPRPLVSVANFFLVFLGFNITATPAVIRLFFLSFFALILGLSDLFWLVMKFTGPFGSAWLDPKYYWRPIYPSVYDRAYLASYPPFDKTADSPQGAGEAKPVPPPLPRMYPPERAPAVWQIYVELVCFCVSPLICFLTAWLAWRIYKRNLLELQASEVGFFLPAGEPEYGATGNAASPPGFYTPDPSRTIAGEGQPLLQPSRGAHPFVPFAGEGMRLGGADAGRWCENEEKREDLSSGTARKSEEKI